MKLFVIDKQKCVGCRGCQVACKDEHVGNDWSPYSAPQPMTGHFWMRVDQVEHGQVPKVRVEYTPVMCQHCEDCALVSAAPQAVHKRDDGLVLIDPVAAQGMDDLPGLCPFGTVYWNSELKVAQKCTGCAHLLDAGEVPHCVDVCATGALRLGDEEDFAEELAQAKTLGLATELHGAGPTGRTRVVYLNEPGFFIGGYVWDPESDEVLIGARVSLLDGAGNFTETTTDSFGDFWFERLDGGTYSICVEASGYESRTVGSIEISESRNVGDVALRRKQ